MTNLLEALYGFTAAVFVGGAIQWFRGRRDSAKAAFIVGAVAAAFCVGMYWYLS